MQVATVKDYHMSVCWARSSWLYPAVRHQVEVRLMLDCEVIGARCTLGDKYTMECTLISSSPGNPMFHMFDALLMMYVDLPARMNPGVIHVNLYTYIYTRV